jgi:hypothetical protein
MKRSNPEFRVYCASTAPQPSAFPLPHDTPSYFKHNGHYRLSDFDEAFSFILAPIRELFFPNIKIQDIKGNLYIIELKAVLTPTGETTNEPFRENKHD